ncbi:hypothetical protein OS493_038915, partial [Desmophyllum pertusum]
ETLISLIEHWHFMSAGAVLKGQWSFTNYIGTFYQRKGGNNTFTYGVRTFVHGHLSRRDACRYNIPAARLRCAKRAELPYGYLHTGTPSYLHTGHNVQTTSAAAQQYFTLHTPQLRRPTSLFKT